MPEGRRTGTNNSTFGGRVNRIDRSAHVARRPVRGHVRRSLDGFELPPKASKTNPITGYESKPVSSVYQPTRSSSRVRPNAKPALPRQSKSAVLTRQAVHAKPKKRRGRTVAHRSRMSTMLVVMAMIVFFSGAVVSYLGWKTNKETAAQVQAIATDNQSDVPAEDEVTTDAINAYQVAPDMPRLIKIPRLEVNARIKRLGVKASGQLHAPSNIYDAGWYEGSSKPGENGTALLDGHVHGLTKPGVFSRLSKLTQGDTIEIERGDGTIFSYKVITSESVDQDKVDMTKALTSIEPGKPGLNIITCTGGYDVRANTYEKRLIVYTVQQ